MAIWTGLCIVPRRGATTCTCRPGSEPLNLKRRILLEYRKVYNSAPDAPYLHARDALPERLGLPFEAIAAEVKELEQGRFLHWKAQDLYKLSPRGIRVTGNQSELDLEFPEH